MQWNVLADCFATKESFPKVDTNILEWNFRKNLIRERILNLNPDIICMQEVEHVEFFKEFLGENYELKFEIKQDHKDGICVGIKKNKLKINFYEPKFYQDENGKEMT
jgi:mRNA deadenylase 3'-5' endonuclease subunit Ccr4